MRSDSFFPPSAETGIIALNKLERALSLHAYGPDAVSLCG